MLYEVYENEKLIDIVNDREKKVYKEENVRFVEIDLSNIPDERPDKLNDWWNENIIKKLKDMGVDEL